MATVLFRTLVLLVALSASLFPPSVSAGDLTAERTDVEELLKDISDITQHNLGSLCVSQPYRSVGVPVRVDAFESARQKAEMLAHILHDVGRIDNHALLETLIHNLVKSEASVQTSRILTYTAGGGSVSLVFMANASRPNSPLKDPIVQREYPTALATEDQSTVRPAAMRFAEMPWFKNTLTAGHRSPTTENMARSSNKTFLGLWTHPYYDCRSHQWQLTYSIPLSALQPKTVSIDRLDGLLAFDVPVSGMDFNQCEVDGNEASASSDQQPPVTYFSGTHKCHNETSTCRFVRGYGWVHGGYTCICRPGFYSKLKNMTLNGTSIELAYRDMMSFNSTVYDRLYRCLPCAEGCTECVDDSPCLARYNWTFRGVLLAFSMLWILMTGVLMAAVYKYRRLKVFKVASPIFLCITLLGCAIMYAEMAAIFPYLSTPSCVATKWTRHMGFCLTYSSLLMKTWRVSLTYRVKSAHKLKLTDQQLLQWMFPILLVMLVYLGAWTVSSPPATEEITYDYGRTRFTQCAYNWWDHSLAIGEILFLIWGIKVCYSVRNAETLFNETKHISWAVYNIALVNTIMVSIHLYMMPNAGPDMKYLFGFIRTQFGTTVTIAIVFGPKFYLVAKGLGDEHDSRARARGVTASFSINGISLANDEPPDLYRENEELKEELQKLAGQMEFMKIVHMGLNNPHLRSKNSGYFHNTSACMQTHASPMPPARPMAPLSVAIAAGGPSRAPDNAPAVVHFEGDAAGLLNNSKVTPVEVSGSTSAAVTSLLVPQAPALLPPPAVAHIKLTSPIEAQLADDSPTNDLIGERV